MSEPTTEAGRAAMRDSQLFRTQDGWERLQRHVLAIEAEAAKLDMGALIEAGFLDAYLNINGVKDEAQARAMLEADVARYHDEIRGSA